MSLRDKVAVTGIGETAYRRGATGSSTELQLEAALLAIAEIHEREITAVGEAQSRTDERLNALITTVERYISEGRNGK